jgi:hypothetical protein
VSSEDNTTRPRRQLSWHGSRLRPLRARLRSGRTSPTEALAAVIGREQAERIVLGLRRTRFGAAATVSSARRLVNGRVIGERYRAQIRLDAPLRTEHSREVTGCVLLLLTLFERMGPSRRVWHRSTWLGQPRQRAHKAGGLSSILGVGVREIERWLAALRTLRVLKNWQPPCDGTTQGARNARGRAYSIYEFPEFSAEFARWRNGQAKSADSHVDDHRQKIDPSSPPRKAPTELAARFWAMIPLPDS